MNEPIPHSDGSRNDESLDRRTVLRRVAAAGSLICGGSLMTQWLLSSPGKTAMEPHGEAEDRYVADALHWDAQGDVVTCRLCPRECIVPPAERGYCGVRENRDGYYKTLVYARPCTICIDPIEKKPLFHFRPGTQAFSLATAGCNIECKFCQNWQISQMRPEQVTSEYVPPAEIIRRALANMTKNIAFTYTEPVIFYEYMLDISKKAKQDGLFPVMISNGYIQEKPMRELIPHLSAIKIDLKAFTEEFYKEVCNGELKPVLETLKVLKSTGIWYEIVVLIIPTLNDSESECRAMVRWILENLGPDVPVHFTRFSAMYKLTNLPTTPVSILERNYHVALEEGLHFPYIGNVPGHRFENTFCPHCKSLLIERYGFHTEVHLNPDGRCPQCNATIPGVWDQASRSAPVT